MDFSELVRARYSCRKFREEPVEREKIEKCIEAARIAPSACNSQPWKFLVLDDPPVLQPAADAAVSGAYGFSRFIKNAPVLIAALADKGSFLARAGSLVRNTKFYLLDMGIVCEHIVLQAAELGLGTCYIGWFNEKALKKELGIPGNMQVPLLICMGYPDENHRPKDPVARRAGSKSRHPLEDILIYNSYK